MQRHDVVAWLHGAWWSFMAEAPVSSGFCAGLERTNYSVPFDEPAFASVGAEFLPAGRIG